MKKEILVLMLGFLLIAVNLYAAGDLIVEGSVGIGTTSPLEKLHLYGNEPKIRWHDDNGYSFDQYIDSAGIFHIYRTGIGDRLVIDDAGNIGIGTITPNTKVDIDGDVALRAGAFTAVNGSNNNINIGGASFIRITGPTAAFSITGIAGGVDGKVVILYNATTYNMTIANENTNSTTTNRITTLTGSGVVTTGVGAITLIYDSTASRWIVTSARL